MTVDARYFDGKTATSLAVKVMRIGDVLRLSWADEVRDFPLAGTRMRAVVGRIPLQIELPDGGLLEIEDHAAARDMFGSEPSLIERLEARWQLAMLSVLVTLAVVGAAWYWGLPWLADKASQYVPVALERRLGNESLQFLDEHWFGKTAVPAARQAALRQAMQKRLALPENCCQLLFRDSKAIGANALALPGGTIVVTDALLALARNDEEILAVLAHELGHVHARHSVRMLVRASGIGVMMALIVGDVGTFGNALTSAPVILMQLSYSREFEQEADTYALWQLKRADIPACRFTDMLSRLVSSDEQRQTLPAWLTTHPDAVERTREFGLPCAGAGYRLSPV